MKTRTWLRTLIAVAAVALSASIQAAETTLKVGDAAPKLQVAKWVQGEPVTHFEAGKVYIVEFWATWCGPCRVLIPHLNELHAKFKDKDLIVIGQDVWERDESLVEPFVKKMGEKMSYRVAMDDKRKEDKGAMAATWMEAAGQNGIPTAFVVNKQGRIAWIGHPMSLKESLLEDVLSDRFDLAQAAAAYEQQEQNKQKVEDLRQKLAKSMASKEWDGAEAAVAELEKLLPADKRDNYTLARFEILAGRGDFDAAYKLVNNCSLAHPDDVVLQNEIAWMIASKPGLEKRDLALAERIALRANLAAKGKEASVLDTLARVQFMNGKKQEAIESQQKAVDLAEGPVKTQLDKVLASYKAGKLPDLTE